ncbi:MAG TPA: glutamate racemase [Candidatus Saccharimonadales bacterium]|nr:glutamate racemase [Candidatus Saccharimonadales bacterium]
MAIIGVFDSGIGGLSVAKAIEQALPDDTVVWRSDHKHIPYGDKLPQEVLGFVMPIFEDMIAEGCDVIVAACNTVTTTLIGELRACFPDTPLIGIEPMVKPAALHTKNGVIAVCATPATLASKRYAWLKETYAQGVTVLEPDCSQWAYMIEHNRVNEQQLQRQIDDLCNKRADVIVLGCTHYHWIEEVIQKLAKKRAVVIQPEQPVIKRLLFVLGRS